MLSFPLCNPEPYFFENVSWLSIRPDLGVERGLAGVNIGFGRIDHLSPFEDFPENQQGEINRDANVGRDEVVARPRLEDVKPVENDDDGEEE